MLAKFSTGFSATVTIESEIKGEIGVGFLVLLGITHTDTDEDIEWLTKKIIGLRIFSDSEGKMNLEFSLCEW